MNATAYVYDETTLQCLYVVTGTVNCVEFECAAHFEQHGTPSTYNASHVRDIELAEVLEV